MKLAELYSILEGVLPTKVFYGMNIYDNNFGDKTQRPEP